MTWVKICGFTRPGDLEVAISLGVDAIGIVRAPSSPRFVPPEELDRLLTLVPVDVLKVAVYGEFLPSDDLAGFDAVQCIGARSRPVGDLLWLDTVRDSSDLDPAEAGSEADYVLLEAWHPMSDGGTGHPINLTWATEFRDRCPRRVILAGGLAPSGVRAAIQAVAPFGVDVSSGVEIAPGIKDAALMERFVRAAREDA